MKKLCAGSGGSGAKSLAEEVRVGLADVVIRQLVFQLKSTAMLTTKLFSAHSNININRGWYQPQHILPSMDILKGL